MEDADIPPVPDTEFADNLPPFQRRYYHHNGCPLSGTSQQLPRNGKTNYSESRHLSMYRLFPDHASGKIPALQNIQHFCNSRSNYVRSAVCLFLPHRFHIHSPHQIPSLRTSRPTLSAPLSDSGQTDLPHSR